MLFCFWPLWLQWNGSLIYKDGYIHLSLGVLLHYTSKVLVFVFFQMPSTVLVGGQFCFLLLNLSDYAVSVGAAERTCVQQCIKQRSVDSLKESVLSVHRASAWASDSGCLVHLVARAFACQAISPAHHYNLL